MYYEKEYDANRIEIDNAFSEGTTGPLYGELDLRPDVFVAAGKCHIYPRGYGKNAPEISCRSKEEFDELAQKYFGIDRQLSGWPRAGTLGTTATNKPTAEISKESHTDATPSPDHECWERAAKATLDRRTSYYPYEPRIEYTSHFDPKSAKCYVESGFYWDVPPPDKTSTGGITVFDSGESKVYGYVLFGPRSTIQECQGGGPLQHCTSKGQFEELALKYFHIDRHQPQPPITKVSMSLPYVSSASEWQIVEDLTYCHENPNNNLQVAKALDDHGAVVGKSTMISCQDATAAIKEQALRPCEAKPESKTKRCRDLLKAVKQYRTGSR